MKEFDKDSQDDDLGDRPYPPDKGRRSITGKGVDLTGEVYRNRQLKLSTGRL